MQRTVAKLIAILFALAALALAIRAAESELWVGIWMMLFIYLALPVGLLTIADLVRAARGKEASDSLFSTAVHVTAVFAFLLGYLLHRIAEWSDSPVADRQVWLPLIFVALVYVVPLVYTVRFRMGEMFSRGLRNVDTLKPPVDETGDHDR